MQNAFLHYTSLRWCIWQSPLGSFFGWVIHNVLEMMNTNVYCQAKNIWSVKRYLDWAFTFVGNIVYQNLRIFQICEETLWSRTLIFAFMAFGLKGHQIKVVLLNLTWISLGKVALNIMVWRTPLGGIVSCSTMRRIWGSKPMSNMRSASSSVR